MTESMNEARLDDELNDESLDRTDAGRFTGCRNNLRVCGGFSR